MVEDRGKDEFSAQNLMKKHEALEAAVEDYRDNVRQLGEVARQLASEGHPQSESIGVRLSQVEKLYAGLKELANERRAKLDDALKLFMLNREVSFRFRFCESDYRISSYSFRGNYSFLNLEIQRLQYVNVRKLFKGGNYMRKYDNL